MEALADEDAGVEVLDDDVGSHRGKRGKRGPVRRHPDDLEIVEEEDYAVPVTGPGGKKRSAPVLFWVDDDEADEGYDAPLPGGRGGKTPPLVWVDDEEDDLSEDYAMPVLTGGPSYRPHYGLRWLSGMFLGWFLLVGSLVGLWYLRPDLIDLWYKKIPASPNAKLSKDYLLRQARRHGPEKIRRRLRVAQGPELGG